MFTVSGPGRYWVRIISPAGWKYDVVPLTIAPAIPPNLQAVNNGPIAPGNDLILSVGSVPNATYAWTKNGVAVANTRMVFISDFTPDMAGTYTVAINVAGCSATDDTDVEALECKVFISSANAAGEETYKLTQSTTETDTFEPLNLSLSNYDGSADFSAYRIEWFYDGNLMDGKTLPTLSTALIGEYTARITLKSNPNTFCETTVTLSGTPCLELGDAAEGCDVNYTVAPPNALASGISLSAGDEFTAGDFMVTVTNIISGDRAGWNGGGYVSIKVGGIVNLKRLAVTFDAAVVNSCYELSSGTVTTAYDPSWSNILDVDGIFTDNSEVVNEADNSLDNDLVKLIDQVQNFDCSSEQVDDIQATLSSITDNLAILTANGNFNNTEINDLQTRKNEITSTTTCLLSKCSNPELDCSLESLKEKVVDFKDFKDNEVLLFSPAPSTSSSTATSSANLRVTTDCSLPNLTGLTLYQMTLCAKNKSKEYFVSEFNNDFKKVICSLNENLYYHAYVQGYGDYYSYVTETETYYIFTDFAYNCGTGKRKMEVATKSQWKDCGGQYPCDGLWQSYASEWGTNPGIQTAEFFGESVYDLALIACTAGLGELAIGGKVGSFIVKTVDAEAVIEGFLDAASNCTNCTAEEFAVQFRNSYAIERLSGTVGEFVIGNSVKMALGFYKNIKPGHMNKLGALFDEVRQQGDEVVDMAMESTLTKKEIKELTEGGLDAIVERLIKDNGLTPNQAAIFRKDFAEGSEDFLSLMVNNPGGVDSWKKALYNGLPEIWRKDPEFLGKLRNVWDYNFVNGTNAKLPNVLLEPTQLTKVSTEVLQQMRNTFNSTVKNNFLKGLGNNPNINSMLKKAGFSDGEIPTLIQRLQNGQGIPDHQVHHKIPLDLGGSNNFSYST